MSSSVSSTTAGQAKGQPSSQEPPGGNEVATSSSVEGQHPEMLSQKWANALPHPHTQCVLSVVCSNTRFRWALHDSSQDDFQPSRFWTTSTPRATLRAARNGGASTDTSGNQEEEEEEDEQQEEPPSTAVEFLSDFFPEAAIRALLVHKRDVPILPDDKVNISSAEESSTTKAFAEKLLPYWAVQRVPTITIYVISSSDQIWKDLQHMVSRLPVRLVRLQAQDFFAPHLLHYKDMGVDRLAALAAAEHLYGGPALVIDGGTTMTFTATAIREGKATASSTTTEAGAPADAAAAAAASNGTATTSSETTTTTPPPSAPPSSPSSNAAMWNNVRVRDGGIGPGCGAKLFALHSDSGESSLQLPQISRDQFKEYVKKSKQQTKDGKPRFILDSAESNPGAMMGMVLHETACHLHSVVATWAKDAIESPAYQRRKRQPEHFTGAPRVPGDAASSVVTKTNKCLYVCITGDEGDLFLDLLKQPSSADTDGQILHPDTVLPKLPCKVEFVEHKHLSHLGIAYLLMMHEQHRRGRGEKLLLANTGTTAPPATIISDIDFNYKVMGQRVAMRRAGRGPARFARGTVLSIEKRRSGAVDDGDSNVYQIAWDDGLKDEMGGEELYDALVLYSTEGENQEKGSVHETLEKLRNAKRYAAKEMSKLLGQHVPAIVARIAEQEAEQQAAAAAAAAQISADNSTEQGGQGSAQDQAAPAVAPSTEDSATVPPKPTAWEGTKQKTTANSNFSTVLPKPTASTWAPGSTKKKVAEPTTAETATPSSKKRAPSEAAPASSGGRPKRSHADSTTPTESESAKKTRRASTAATAATSSRKKTPSKTKKSASSTADGGPLMPPTPKSLKTSPKAYLKQRVAKYFDDGVLYFGTVHSYKYTEEYGGLWRIHYDDGDKEDYIAKDMIENGKEYEMHKHDDPQLKKESRRRR